MLIGQRPRLHVSPRAEERDVWRGPCGGVGGRDSSLRAWCSSSWAQPRLAAPQRPGLRASGCDRLRDHFKVAVDVARWLQARGAHAARCPSARSRLSRTLEALGECVSLVRVVAPSKHD